MIPAVLDGLPIHWHGVDDSTPAGCELVVTEVVGIATTYVLRDGAVIGRVEANGSSQVGYAGGGLKGGSYVGSDRFYDLAVKIAEAA